MKIIFDNSMESKTNELDHEFWLIIFILLKIKQMGLDKVNIYPKYKYKNAFWEYI